MTAQQLEHIDRYLGGVTFFSTGACPGCADCGLAPKECDHCEGTGATFDDNGTELEPDCPHCKGEGKIECSEHNRELAEESHFSWHSCETCGSHLGGDRHPAHGWINLNGKDALCHFSVCTDCLLHFNGCDDE